MKQVFHSQHLQGTAGFSAGAEALHPEPVWSVLQTLQPLFSRCLNTEGWHRKVALFTHTVSDSKPRVPHPHPVAFWEFKLPERPWAFLHTLLIGDSWRPGMWAQLCFLLLGLPTWNVFGGRGNHVADAGGGRACQHAWREPDCVSAPDL